jgi:hypothetical protein
MLNAARVKVLFENYPKENRDVFSYTASPLSDIARRMFHLLVEAPAYALLAVYGSDESVWGAKVRDAEGSFIKEFNRQLNDTVFDPLVNDRSPTRSDDVQDALGAIVGLTKEISEAIPKPSLDSLNAIEGLLKRILKSTRSERPGSAFYKFVRDNRRRYDLQFDQWREVIGTFSRLGGLTREATWSQQGGDTMAFVLALASEYLEFIMTQVYTSLEQRDHSTARIEELTQLIRHAEKNDSNPSSKTDAMQERLVSEIDELFDKLSYPQVLRVSDTIVQATNVAFELVRYGIPAYKHLPNSDALALTDDDQVLTSFATIVAQNMNSAQILASRVPYVQNKRTSDIKLQKVDGVAFLRGYIPIGPLSDNSGGYRFQRRH